MSFSSVYPYDVFLLSSYGSGLQSCPCCVLPSRFQCSWSQYILLPTVCLYSAVLFISYRPLALRCSCREIAWSVLPAIHFTACMAGHCCLNYKRCLFSYLCNKLSCYCAASIPRCHPIRFLVRSERAAACSGDGQWLFTFGVAVLSEICPCGIRVGKKWNGTDFFLVLFDSPVRYSTSAPDSSWSWSSWSSSPWPFICNLRSVVWITGLQTPHPCTTVIAECLLNDRCVDR